jgi:hypothetical protein
VADYSIKTTYDKRLFILMVATSVLSMVMASKVGHLLDELSNKYIPAYGHLARRWEQARAGFRAVLEAVPTDGPSATLLSRIDHLQEHPPSADWDGAWRLENK